MKTIAFFLILVAGCAMAKYPLSDHYDGKTFSNITPTEHKSLFAVLKWKITTQAAQWPDEVKNNSYDLPRLTDEKTAIVTWINHATFLIQMKDLVIMTDPIFSERASPFTFLGPKRVRNPGFSLDVLPKVDVVLISHNHYDHLDLESLKILNQKFSPLFIVPLGDKELLESAGIRNVLEQDWWNETRFSDIKITFLPAQHWSARGLFDKSKTLWGSYLIDNGKKKIYFAGDTGYGKHFSLIKEKFGKPDLSLLPIGAYEPRWFMKDYHMNPEDAVGAHLDLGTQRSIGMHFGTFQLTDESIDDPVHELDRAKAKFQIKDNEFMLLDTGESYQF